MSVILLLNKPFQVLTQFTDTEGRSTLADYVNTSKYPQFYAAGRLDYDSEGLVVLTNNGEFQHRLANPKFKLPKTYWVQVEGCPSEQATDVIAKGLILKDGPTRPCSAKVIPQPDIWSRNPPIRHRENSPTHWLEISLTEGKNRQVRRMTAAVGLPTLRLIRVKIGDWDIRGLAPGELKEADIHLPVSAKQHKAGKSKRNNLPRRKS